MVHIRYILKIVDINVYYKYILSEVVQQLPAGFTYAFMENAKPFLGLLRKAVPVIKSGKAQENGSREDTTGD